MSQPPGSGSGPYGRQPGQPPFGQQTPQNPYGPPPTYEHQPGQPSQPNPYGSLPPQAPPAPQQPVFGQQAPQPPYGSSPAPARGGTQPYVPGQGWSPGAPPQAYGSAATPAPPAYSSPLDAYPPVPPAEKSRTGLVIGVVAAVLVLLVGGGFLVSQAMKKPAAVPPIATPSASSSTTASATSSASGYPGFTLSGTTLSGSNFSSLLPTGWKLSAHNGGDNRGEIIDEHNNLVDYFSNFPRAAVDNCAYYAAAIAGATGVETAQPPVAVNDAVWGSDKVTGVEVTYMRASQTEQEVIGYYCADHAGVSVMVRSIAWLSDRASVQAGAKALIASWKWQ